MRKKEDSMEAVSDEGGVSTKKKCCGQKGKLGLLILVVALAVAGYYLWTVYKSPLSEAEMQAQAIEKTQEIVAKVSRLMVVPEGELPQVAEIKDAALAAKEQPFLTGSQNGDLLLVYTQSGKAIVYSPTRNVIVNVGPVQTGAPSEVSTGADEAKEN